MSMVIGRCALQENPYNMSSDGRSWSFSVDIVPATVGDANEMKARRQQLAGYDRNTDEEVVPVTWSEDSSYDGFWRVVSISVPSTDIQLTTGWISGCQISLERVVGFSNPWFEVCTQALVRTNGHAVTAPTTVLATYSTSTGEADFRPSLTAPTVNAGRFVDTGQQVTIYEFVAPVTPTQYRAVLFPSSYYDGSCKVEIKYGTTWYPVVGREIPLTTAWRITNGLVRLTAATGTTAGTAGTLEIWDQTAGVWDSQPVAHWTNAAVAQPIGWANGVLVSSLSVLRNSPEQVVVKCSGQDIDFTYSIQRGAHIVTSSWTAQTAFKGGCGSASLGAIAGTAITGGVRATANNASGNRMVYGTAAAVTTDLINTGAWVTTAATTGSIFFGVELDGTTATAHNQAAALAGQFLGATVWRQRIVPK